MASCSLGHLRRRDCLKVSIVGAHLGEVVQTLIADQQHLGRTHCCRILATVEVHHLLGFQIDSLIGRQLPVQRGFTDHQPEEAPGRKDFHRLDQTLVLEWPPMSEVSHRRERNHCLASYQRDCLPKATSVAEMVQKVEHLAADQTRHLSFFGHSDRSQQTPIALQTRMSARWEVATQIVMKSG